MQYATFRVSKVTAALYTARYHKYMGERYPEPSLPDPDKHEVRAWQANLTPETVHEELWPQINRQFHGITIAARDFNKQHYSPEAETIFLDGLTFALSAIERSHDMQVLRPLFESVKREQTVEQPPTEAA